MTSIIIVPVPDSVVGRADIEPMIATLSAGREVRFSYILGVDEPKVLTEILQSGDALVIFNVADSTVMEVAAGVAERWLRESGL